MIVASDLAYRSHAQVVSVVFLFSLYTRIRSLFSTYEAIKFCLVVKVEMLSEVEE